jgi:hypothetical protein
VAEGDDLSQQEAALRRATGELSQGVAQARELLTRLAPGAGGISFGKADETLRRLSAIAGNDFQSVYGAVRDTYPDYRQLEADLDTLRQLAQLGRHAPAVLAAKAYLEAAAAPPHLTELSIQRRALLAALSPGSLLQLSQSWSLLEQQVSAFKARYGAAYLAHHQDTHQALPGYLEELDTVRRELRALALLNTLPELGEPTGQGLAEALEQLGEGPPPCAVPSGDLPLPLETAPRCPACALGLEQELPVQALERLGATITSLLAAKHRRLSNLLVEQVLQGRADPRLDDFLKIVQASDLSALSNTLSDELVAFLRQMLG